MLYLRILGRLGYCAFTCAYCNGIMLSLVGGPIGVVVGTLYIVFDQFSRTGEFPMSADLFFFGVISGGFWAGSISGCTGILIGTVGAWFISKRSDFDGQLTNMMTGSVRGSLVGIIIGTLSGAGVGLLMRIILPSLTGGGSPGVAGIIPDPIICCLLGMIAGFAVGAMLGAWVFLSGATASGVQRLLAPLGPLAYIFGRLMAREEA
jgi:hypothetical protein